MLNTNRLLSAIAALSMSIGASADDGLLPCAVDRSLVDVEDDVPCPIIGSRAESSGSVHDRIILAYGAVLKMIADQFTREGAV